MARFSVPSTPSTPSTPGTPRSSTKSNSSSEGPRTPTTSGPNTFTVPSASTSPSSSTQSSPRQPQGPPLPIFNPPNPSASPAHFQTTGDRSPWASSPATAPVPGSFGDVDEAEDDLSSPYVPNSSRGKRSRTPSPDSPSRRRRRNNYRPPTVEDADDEGEDVRFTVVPAGVVYGGSGSNWKPDDSDSSSSDDSDDDDGPPGGGGSPPGDDHNDDDDGDDDDPSDPDPDPNPNNDPPSRRSSSSSSNSSRSPTHFPHHPLPSRQPSRRPGHFTRTHPPPAKALTLLRERPGQLPTHTLRSPTSPGFDWSDGGCWWYPPSSNGKENVVREIFHPDAYARITKEEAEGVVEVLRQENLINILGGDGFASETTAAAVRQEVVFEFCAGGTLNKLLLSRRDSIPPAQPRQAATWLPTPRDKVLGLPEDLVWYVMISLLRASSWLHHRRQPIVHCGIDPANVFFTAPLPGDERPLARKYGLVKLGNFSRAVVLPHAIDPEPWDEEAIEERCAMFEHMVVEYQESGYEAPEMLGMLGEDEVCAEKFWPGPGSDVFSIGVVCFAMMTGKTIWDLLLERRFVARAEEPGRREAAVLEEKWRFAAFEERMGMLQAVLRGEQVLVDTFPGFYSRELRDFVTGLLDLEPERRGESAILLDEAEDAFAERCAESDGNGMEKMQRVWKRAVRGPAEKRKMAEMIRGAESILPPEMVRAMKEHIPLVA